MKKLLLIITAFAVPALANDDPSSDRAALRQAAVSANDAATRAAAVPLVPERAAEISSDLDQSVAQADLAANAAKSLETGAAKRGDEMTGELKGRGEPAPSSAAKDLAAATAAQRARWTTLSKDHDDLQARADALGNDNTDTAFLESKLKDAAVTLSAADAALTRGAADAATMARSADDMELARTRARASAAELSAADADVVRLDAALPPLVAEAKAATALLGQEPQGPNRTRAGQKISAPRDITGALFTAADRACNRADDYASRSAAFARAQSSFEAARSDAAATPDAAKKSLDDASAAQDAVRSRLDHPRP
jgi:hypothetical protein